MKKMEKSNARRNTMVFSKCAMWPRIARMTAAWSAVALRSVYHFGERSPALWRMGPADALSAPTSLPDPSVRTS